MPTDVAAEAAVAEVRVAVVLGHILLDPPGTARVPGLGAPAAAGRRLIVERLPTA